MSKKSKKMIVCFLALLLSGMSWITEGAFVFTQTPNETVYFMEGSNATFKWEYSVDNKAAEFDFILWNVITNVSRTLLFEDASGAVRIGSLIPDAYKGRVRKEGQATLVIQDVNFDDSEVSFQCALHAKSGAVNADSVKLIVTGRSSLDAQLKLGEVGGSVVFICNATGVPEQMFSWSKQHGQTKTVLRDNGQNVTIVSFNGSSILTLNNIAGGDRGYYVCDATANVDQPNSASGYLQMPDRASLDDQFKFGELGGSVVFICNATDVPKQIFSWSKSHGQTKTVLRDNGQNVTIVSVNGSSILTLKNIAVGNQGYYVCNASASVDQPNLAIGYLQVLEPLKIDDTSGPRSSFPTAVNESQTLCCPVRGYPPPIVTWKRDGAEMPRGEDKCLTITTAKPGDFGNYTCVATDIVNTIGPFALSIVKKVAEMSLSSIDGTTEEPASLKWEGVTGAEYYVVDVMGSDIHSDTMIVEETSLEIHYHTLVMMKADATPSETALCAEVTALNSEADVIGKSPKCATLIVKKPADTPNR